MHRGNNDVHCTQLAGGTSHAFLTCENHSIPQEDISTPQCPKRFSFTCQSCSVSLLFPALYESLVYRSEFLRVQRQPLIPNSFSSTDLNDYAKTYRSTRDAYLKEANACASQLCCICCLAIVAFEYDLQTVRTPFPCLRVVIRLKLATGPYKAARDAYVAATATYTKSLYE